MTRLSVGGVILCGGMSKRMGQPKAMLPFGKETMLARVARLLGEVAQPLVVVGAPDQELPKLNVEIQVVRDRMGRRGPLEGMAVGLRALATSVDAAYVTSCDVPLLRPSFIRKMIQLLEDNEVCVPKDDRFHHPLAAVYRTRVVSEIEWLLQANRMRPVYLFDKVKTRQVSVEELRDADDQLLSLENINHPDDYFRALLRENLEIPAVVRSRLGQPEK